MVIARGRNRVQAPVMTAFYEIRRCVTPFRGKYVKNTLFSNMLNFEKEGIKATRQQGNEESRKQSPKPKANTAASCKL
jgi:hypothetical protein